MEYRTRWCLLTFSDRAADAVLEQWLEKTLENRGSAAEHVAQTLLWLTSGIHPVAVALAGSSTVMSTLLQECTSPHPSCFTGLVILCRHAIFQASMCRRKKGCTHQCKLFFLTVCSLTSKYKLSSHDLVFDLPLWLQACRKRNIKVRNG